MVGFRLQRGDRRKEPAAQFENMSTVEIKCRRIKDNMKGNDWVIVWTGIKRGKKCGKRMAEVARSNMSNIRFH